MRVLGCEVTDDLVATWVGRLAPQRQPFVVDDALAELVGEDAYVAPEIDDLDTYLLYGRRRLRWLTEAQFLALPRPARASLVRHQHDAGRGLVPSVRSAPADVRDAARQQADGHRFVWWPSLMGQTDPVAVAVAYVTRHWTPSLSPEHVAWQALPSRMADARTLAATFADESGPNCYGAVMGAAGVDWAPDTLVEPAVFESWLAEHTRHGGDDQVPGTVLVWREGGAVSHAALTLGGRLVLNKPSQGWYTPRFVWPVDVAMGHSRFRGGRLERHHLVG